MLTVLIAIIGKLQFQWNIVTVCWVSAYRKPGQYRIYNGLFWVQLYAYVLLKQSEAGQVFPTPVSDPLLLSEYSQTDPNSP